MYIVDGIAYAGEQVVPMRVKSVRAKPNYRLLVTFTNGEQKEFDFTSLLDAPAFLPLKDESKFKSVYVDYGIVMWDGGIDISTDKLYSDGVSV